MDTLIQHRITVKSDLCGGQPTIRGMRIRVADVLEMLAGGMSVSEILNDYAYLEKLDIQACLQYAAQTAKHEEVSLKPDSLA